MKKLLFTFVVAICAMATFAKTSKQLIKFVELPYTEGTIYLSVNVGDSTVVRQAIEVEDTEMSIPVDFSSLTNLKVFVQAFQDLNENRNLDKDNFGRPTEPCLQTTLMPNDSTEVYVLRMMTF